jgi:glyoxylase-like metal-dependent hydrolase (beta-lactamase superfamily II)
MATETAGQLTELGDGVYAIDTPFEDVVNTVYFVDGDDGITLVDTGVVDTPEQFIFPALDRVGKKPADIRRILLTHGHMDHRGGVGHVLQENAACELAVHPADKSWVEDIETYLDQMYGGLGPHWSIPAAFANRIRHLYGTPTVTVTQTFEDGERITLGEGHTLSVHHIPAHSAGHVLFFHEEARVAMVGDAVQGYGFPLGDRPDLFPFYYSVEAYTHCLDLCERLEPTTLGTAHYGPCDPARAKELIAASREIRDEIHAVVEGVARQQPDVSLTAVIAALRERYPRYMEGIQYIETGRAHMQELTRLGVARPGSDRDTWEVPQGA